MKTKFDAKTIKSLMTTCKKSSKVVGWYLHKYDTSTGGSATIRGPWHRWITIREGIDPQTHGNRDRCGLADAQDDAEYVHAAMSYFPTALVEIQKLQKLVRQLKKDKASLKFKINYPDAR